MATQPIKTSDIIQENVLQKTIKEFQAWDKVIKIVETDLKELAKVTKEGINVIDEKDAKSIQQLSEKLLELKKQTKALDLAKKESEKASKNIVKLRKEESDAILKSQKALLNEASIREKNLKNKSLEIKLSQQEINFKNKNTQLTKKETLELQKKNIATAESNRQSKLIIGLSKTKTGSIENLRLKLSLVTNEWKKLTAQELENTKRGKRLVASKKELTATLLKLEQKTGDNRRQVGNYSIALSGLRGKLISVANAAGLTTGIFGAFRVLKSSITLVRDFEKANAVLSGVLNITKKETQLLTNNAIELSKTSVKTAKDITQLQIAFARLGFTQSEIIDITGATLNGSIALNSGLEETADLVGAVINSFDGLSSSNANQIVETLSASTTKTALNFEKLATALPIVSGAANAVGVPLEEVTALLGKLSDAGIDASSSATSLRNVFIESAARGIDYEEALGKIRESSDKLTTANELFGKRAAVSALIVANNANEVKGLTKELKEAEIVQSLVNKQVDTLDGSVKLLTSAWEGYVLESADANNVTSILKDSIKFLADNLQTIIDVIKIAVISFTAYKVAIIATNAVNKIGITINTAATLATNARTIATNIATKAQQAFNKASKANVIGIIIALLAAAVTAYLAFGSAAADAAKQQEKVNKARQKASKDESEIISKEIENNKERIKEFKREIETRKLLGEDSLELSKELFNLELKVNQEQREKTESEILKFNKKIKEIEAKAAKELIEIKKPTETVNLGFSSAGGSLETQADIRASREKAINNELEISVNALKQRIKDREEDIKSLNKELTNSQDNLLKNQIKTNNKSVENEANTIRQLRILRERLEDLRNENIKNAEKRELAISKTKFDREIKSIKGRTKVEKELIKELEKTAEIDKKRIKDSFLLVGAIEKQEKKISDLTDKKSKALEVDIAAINVQLELANIELKRLQDLGNKEGDSIDEITKRRKEANEDIKQINLDRAADDIEIQGRNLKETLANIEEKSKREEKAIRNRYRRLLEQDGLLAEEKAKIQLELQNELADSEKKFSDLSDSFKNKDLEKFKNLQQSLTEALENALDSRFDLIQANLDKELDASKKQQDRLQDLADKGSADALESLQVEREKEQKLEEEKLKQERKQANIKKGIEVYKILASNDGDVGKTISDVAILEALIKSLPTAYDGMEDTGSGGNLDSKGGFLSVLHPNEAVVKASTNKKKLKAGLTNEQAVEYAIKYQHLKPKMNDKVEVKNDNQQLVNIEKILKDLPNNMPTQDLFFDEQEKAYVRIIKQNGKVNRVHTRSKGLFR